LQEGLWLIALAAVGGAVGVVLRLRAPNVEVIDLVAQTGSAPPWEIAAGVALVVVGVFRFVPRLVPGRARRLADSVLRSSWKGPASLAIFLTPWLFLGGWAIIEFVWQAAWQGGAEWSKNDRWTAGIALAGPGLVAFLYALFSVQRRGGAIVDAFRRLTD
jgi:hypothetical protein